MEKSNEIDYRFKILYALAMILVVDNHHPYSISLLEDWFPAGSFHLALFMFGSGYFFNKKSLKNINGFILYKIKKLIIPLYLYTFSYAFIVALSKNFGFSIGGEISLNNLLISPINNGHAFVYNLAGWFIAPLFMVQVFSQVIRKLLNKMIERDMYYFCISLVIGIFGNYLACRGYYTGLWLVLTRFAYFIPFYELDILYRSTLEKYDNKIPTFFYLVIIFLLQGLIIFIYKKPLTYRPVWTNNFENGPIMPIVVGIIGIALWLRVAKIMEPIIGKNKFVNAIADNTYSIMMNHLFGFMLLKGCFGLLAEFKLAFTDFDFAAFKSTIWYVYIPRGANQLLILYTIVGIGFSIFVQKVINVFKNKFYIAKKYESESGSV